MATNMTEGRPMRHIINFTLPLMAGMAFQRLYNMVDTAIVGRLLGASALAAVGATGSITFLTIGFCMGICSGFAIPVAQYFGAGDEKTLKKCVGTGIWSASVIGLLMTIVTVLFCRPILLLMNTPGDIIDLAYDYLVVIFAAIPATMLYNLISGLLRSLGDSRHPLYFLILSSVLNIILDILFVAVFHMGVGGAAWATLISQAVSGLASLLYVARSCVILHPGKEGMCYNSKIAKQLLGYGVPMGLQYSITAIGSAILQYFINGLGTASVAAITAGQKLEMLLCILYDSLGGTMTTYCGQNVGAWKLDRLSPGVRDACLLGSVYSIFIFFAMLFFGRQCSMLFLDPSETEIITMSARYLVINTAFYLFLMLVNVLRFSIQGMGFPVLAITAGVMELIGRASAGIVLVPVLGYDGACFGSPLAWIIADVFLLPACIGCIHKLKKAHERMTLQESV